MIMHAMEMLYYIKKTAQMIDKNLQEAERHIKKAHEMRDDCRMTADWYKEMAHRHLEFNVQGRALYERKMRELTEAEGAAEYLPGIKAAYGAWMNDINEKTAEVMAMIQMYK